MNNINVAFVFDDILENVATVCIASLLDNRKGSHYNIYCVITNVDHEKCDYISKVVKSRDEESNIYFCNPPENFRDENKQKFEIRGINDNTYMWMFLHRIVPNEDKIIYLDVDLLFYDSLIGIWEQDVENYYALGVKGGVNFEFEVFENMPQKNEMEGLQGKYVNSGVLLLNLRKIRELNPDALWTEMSYKQYHFQDQDILNITCKNQIGFLSIKYNFQAHLIYKWYKRYFEEGLYSKEECIKAWNSPIILHFTGPKPWYNRGAYRAEKWWNYVGSQSDLKILFNKEEIPYIRTVGIRGVINRKLKRL